jgi:septal ring factor EnvC (AmiA/AmiB activator)
VAARDRELLESAKRDRAELVALQAEQQAQVARADALARSAHEARTAAAQAARAREALLARVVGERETAERLVGELQQAESQLQTMLAATRGGGARPPSPTGPAAILPLAPFKGDLDWPVEGRVLARFGRERQRYGTVLPRTGIEIGASATTPVQALHEGRVVFADAFAGLGRLVIVEHGPGAFSLYGHLGSIAVQRGETVTRGGRVGAVGRTPNGAEAMYFELRIDGHPVDPLEWLKPQALRGSRPR